MPFYVLRFGSQLNLQLSSVEDEFFRSFEVEIMKVIAVVLKLE